MTWAAQPASRRRFLAATAASVAAVALGRRESAAQSGGAPDDWRLISAQAPGPLIRVRRGERIMARLVNDLAEPIALNWHGLRVPAAIDGRERGLTPVSPGAVFYYSFTPPDAGTYWYQARRLGRSGRPRLQGAVIVDEATPVDVDQDILAVLTTATPDGGGITVNGLPSLDIPVRRNDRVRLRLVNAAPARILVTRIAGHRVRVMAIDGQPAEPFVARDGEVFLGPGNRIDLFIDAALSAGARAPILIESDRGETARLYLTYADGPARAARPDVAALPANPLPQRMDFRGALRVDLRLDNHGLNASPDKPAFTAARGRTVMLAIANRSAAPWVLHLHGHHVRLLDRLDDGWKPFWLDTIMLPAGQVSRVAFVADNPGDWDFEAEMIGAAGTVGSGWFAVA